MKTTTSFASNSASMPPHSSQSQSFIRTRTPGLTESPLTNISGRSLIKLDLTHESKPLIVTLPSPSSGWTSALCTFTEFSRSSSSPPPNSRVRCMDGGSVTVRAADCPGFS
uniref:URM1 n=1 Tax=Arundo donax TaxID=35708 RepID=A0A0A9GAZ1_ARUDO